jgi:putative ABC transport system permease protein
MIRLSGRFRSALLIGGQGIRARKLRALLSMVSLFLGVLAVVVVQAGAEIGKRALLSDLELTVGKDGTRQMFLPPGPQTLPIALDTLRARPDAVAIASTRAIIGEPGVMPVNPGGAPFRDGGSPAEGPYFGPDGPMVICDERGNCRAVERPGGPDAGAPRGQAIELNLTALTGDVRQFRPFRPVSGRWLDFSSTPSMAPRIVLNLEAAEGFARHVVPAEMRVEGATANPTPQIIGVVDDGNELPAAYVRTDELLNWLPDSGLSDPRFGGGLQVMLAPTAGEVEQTLRLRLAANGVTQPLHVETINSRKSISTELALMRWIFLGMAGLVLLIGVAGVLNVGLATVGERVEEFALRRAVGTSRTLLAGIVLAETLLTGLLTAAAAIGVGIAGLELVDGLISTREPALQDLTFPWQAGVAGVIAGLTAGVLGGLIPAIRAARIPIATVMRA